MKYADDLVAPLDIMDVLGTMPEKEERPVPEVTKPGTEIKKKQKKEGPKRRYKFPVYQYTKDGTFLRKFDCIKDAAAEVGIMGEIIARASNGGQKTAGGYVWRREFV